MNQDQQDNASDNLTKEIERKFIISELPPEIKLDELESDKIDQGYLGIDERGATRIRRKGEHYFITWKGGNPTHSTERIELEAELTKEQFDTLWPGTINRRVEKTRYIIPYDKYIIELDVLEGVNRGHILAEVEFESTEEADKFQVPEWFGTDVTSEKRFDNASIATNGFPH